MKHYLLRLFLLLASTSLYAQANKVTISSADDGMKLMVDGQEFIINGMNWDYVPIGSNYSYNFWAQSDDFIKEALDSEMGLLKNMGVNTIRVYTGMQPKWVQYIYENYGIYTMINHSFGRYGLTLNGTWMSNTEYADPDAREFLLKEATKTAREFMNTPGLLMFMLGNENNYGLSWGGAETEDIPIETEGTVITRARAMYKVMNEAVLAMKEIDNSHPIAVCNGDLLYIDLVAEYLTDMDIYATNMYRGVSFGNSFTEVKEKLNKPIMFSEFGSDAFNALQNKEDQKMQAYYMVNNWKEIYQNVAGLGKAGNSIGGFTFQFSDGWWKRGQTEDLDIHNTEASWLSGGYTIDTKDGSKNMNEEWFGICAKGRPNERGLYELYPRAAYYALKTAHSLNPYALGVTQESVTNHFSNIELMDAVLRARGDKAAAVTENSKIKISSLRAEFTTFNTGGDLITTPEERDPNAAIFPDQLGFDNMESYFVGIEANPTPGLRANVEANILGNVARNPIDEIFYENRGRPVAVQSNNGEVFLADNNRVQIYQAEFDWDTKYAAIKGFYRTGHYHWGYEGDFFGLYPEANYGPNIDIYNGVAPFGAEFTGKEQFEGLKVAFGPELWWGANPAVLVKYEKQVGKYKMAGIFHEDFARQGGAGVTSGAIPQPRTRRVTGYVQRQIGKFDFELGGIWGGQPLNGRKYQVVRTGQDGTTEVFTNKIDASDNWGGKAKVKYTGGSINWYAQGAAQGLVAFGGADNTRTFTGWRLKDSGTGNQYNFLTGFTYRVGNFEIAPNFLWQEPIVDPIPLGAPAPARSRNILEDPFVVRSNRKTTAGELLLTYDPTPGSWFYEWDNDRAEDALFAASLGFVYRHLPTTQDAAIGFFGDSRAPVAFASAPSAEDLWEINGRIVSKITPDFGFIANFFGGNGQANGSDDRLIYRYGSDVRVVYNKLKLMTEVKVDDWGPFDFHRDFNLTFPFQFKVDLSTTLGKPGWFILPNTRLGIRYTWRSLDNFSPRYEFQDPLDLGFPNGNEWEIRTYLHINIGK